MPNKTRKTTGRRARARSGNRQDHERPRKLRTRSANRAKRQPSRTGRSADAGGLRPADDGSGKKVTLRANLTRIGSHARFFITGADSETVVTSRLYPTPQAAKQGLIALVVAIQADDFETFDHT